MPKNRIHTRNDGKKIYKTSDQHGKRHQIVQRTGEAVKDFRKRCDRLDEELATRQGEKRLTFDDLFNLWSEKHLSSTSKSNQRGMEEIYKKHVEKPFGHLYLDDIKTFKIYNFMQEKIEFGYSKSYIAKIKRCFLSPFRWGKQSGLLVHNPAENIILSFTDKNKREPTNKALTDEQLETFFSYSSKTKYHNFFKLLILLGLRPSECLALQFNDIEADFLHVKRAITLHDHSTGKTLNAQRTIPLSAEALKTLGKIKNNSKWLFPSATGEPSFSAVNSSFKRILRSSGLKITLYSFRHTFATRCARSGMQPKTLQYLMGHAKIETTLNFYVDIQKEELEIAKSILNSINSKKGNFSGNKAETQSDEENQKPPET